MAYKDLLDPRNRAAKRKHYNLNKEAYKARSAQLRKDMQAWVDHYKSVPCMDCGGTFPPVCMDLDHRDPSSKVEHISKLVTKGNWRRLIEEVAKCDVVCANCHRVRTHIGVSVG